MRAKSHGKLWCYTKVKREKGTFLNEYIGILLIHTLYIVLYIIMTLVMIQGWGGLSMGSYTTKQVAELYGIGVDSLYYYERIGILVPKRDPNNNYRRYSGTDIQKLSIIREMLKLGFDTEHIRDYLNDKSLAKTTALYNAELAEVSKRIFELMKVRNELESRMMTISRAIAKSHDKEIGVSTIPARGCIMVSDSPVNYFEIEDTIARYSAEHGNATNATAMADCYTVDVSRLNEFNCYESKNLFLYSEDGNYTSNFELPSGTYVTCTFRGFVWKSPRVLPKMLAYAHDNNLEAIADPMEFCIVDEYESDNEDEYITRLELPVVAAGKDGATPRTDKLLLLAEKTEKAMGSRTPSKRIR